MIKYLVISGGDLTFLSMMGLVKEMQYSDELKMDVKELYTVSAGSWIGLLLSLKINFDEVIDYFLERPWNKLVNITSNSILNLYTELGLLDVNILYEMFKPFLKSCNLSEECTFKQLYEYSEIKLNIYATNANTLNLDCFNYINTPDVKVIDAIYMSSSIPILFKPMKYKEDHYIDGCYSCNYPMDLCLKEHENMKEILGIEATNFNDPTVIGENENILSFYGKIFYKLVLNKRTEFNKQANCEHNKIIIVSNYFTFDTFLKIVNEKETRLEWINLGVDAFKTYLHYKLKS